MIQDVEQISIALVSQITSYFTANSIVWNNHGQERSIKIWGNVAPANQPALFVFLPDEDGKQDEAFGLSKWVLEYKVLVYARADAEPDTVPETILNAYRLAIFSAIRSTPPGEKNTLGGRVEHAWIEGQILRDMGILDQQLVLMIPVKVLIGSF